MPFIDDHVNGRPVLMGSGLQLNEVLAPLGINADITNIISCNVKMGYNQLSHIMCIARSSLRHSATRVYSVR